MTATPVSQATVGGFLFADGGIASALEASGTADAVREKLASFTQATRKAAIAEIERVSAELLNLSMTDVVLGALRTSAELHAAGQRTIAEPDSEELVELVSRQVTLQNRPSVDLLIDGARTATVHMVLSLVIDIQALTAVVRQGRLTALQIGRCVADASVSIEGAPVASRHGELQLPASLPLGTGLALTGTDEDDSPDSPR